MPLDKPAGCVGCPAYEVGQGYTTARGPTKPQLVAMGQGPGRDEYLTGLPFVGPTGRKLEAQLVRAGYDPDQVYFDNVCRCWLPLDRAPTTAEVAHCRAAHWGPALAQVDCTRGVAVGLVAGREVLGLPKLTEASLGLLMEVDL